MLLISPPVVQPVKEFDAQHQRVAGLCKKEFCFTLHVLALVTNRSVPITQTTNSMNPIMERGFVGGFLVCS